MFLLLAVAIVAFSVRYCSDPQPEPHATPSMQRSMGVGVVLVVDDKHTKGYAALETALTLADLRPGWQILLYCNANVAPRLQTVLNVQSNCTLTHITDSRIPARTWALHALREPGIQVTVFADTLVDWGKTACETVDKWLAQPETRFVAGTGLWGLKPFQFSQSQDDTVRRLVDEIIQKPTGVLDPYQALLAKFAQLFDQDTLEIEAKTDRLTMVPRARMYLLEENLPL